MISITYSLNLVLSYSYFGVMIQCLEPQIFNEKDELLFYKIEDTE